MKNENLVQRIARINELRTYIGGHVGKLMALSRKTSKFWF